MSHTGCTLFVETFLLLKFAFIDYNSAKLGETFTSVLYLPAKQFLKAAFVHLLDTLLTPSKHILKKLEIKNLLLRITFSVFLL